MAKCKLCGGEIVLLDAAGGQKIPCDPEPVRYWEMDSGHGRIMTPDGRIISCKLNGWPDTAAGFGYVPHEVTCPERHKNNKER